MEEEKEKTIDGQAEATAQAEAPETEAQAEASETAEAPEAEAQPAEPAEPSLEEQLAELHDKYLRSVAEFDNYRKRTLREKTELILNGGEKTITAILPVLDDMERAIANGKKTDDVEALREGMELIWQKFEKVLAGMGVSRIDTDGADFDTDVHEAIAMIPAPSDEMKGKVMDCVQTGYKLNDKVIRHAKVAVGQ